MSKLQEKHSTPKNGHPALQKMKFINVFLCLWEIFALLDSDLQLNPDPIRIRIHCTDLRTNIFLLAVVGRSNFSPWFLCISVNCLLILLITVPNRYLKHRENVLLLYFEPVTVCVTENVRNHHGLSTELYEPTDYDRLALSLLSPLPNEQVRLSIKFGFRRRRTKRYLLFRWNFFFFMGGRGGGEERVGLQLFQCSGSGGPKTSGSVNLLCIYRPSVAQCPKSFAIAARLPSPWSFISLINLCIRYF